MMRMRNVSFQFLLANIEGDITPVELEKVGLSPISPAERFTPTLHFLATGNSFQFLSFQFRISQSAVFTEYKKFAGQLSQIWPAHT